VTRWEDLPDDVRADVKRAAMTQLDRNLSRVVQLLDDATTDLERRRLANRHERIQRALAAAQRLP